MVSNHGFALIRREGNWECIESSEHKLLEEKLQTEETRFRFLYEQTPDLYLSLNPDGQIIECSS